VRDGARRDGRDLSVASAEDTTTREDEDVMKTTQPTNPTMKIGEAINTIKTKKLTLAEVRALYEVHLTTTRDFASELLGGDPFQAQSVADRIFDSMLGRKVDVVASADKLPAWIADQVLRECLKQTGNGGVARRLGALARYRRKGGHDEEALAGPGAVVLPFRRDAGS
jgi:hypothetical protein